MTWVRAHGVTWQWALVVAGCSAASVVLARVGLPRLDPSPVIDPVNLQQIGIVALAAVAGTASLAIHDSAPWLVSRAARPLPVLRGCWFLGLSAAYVLLGLLGVPFLPPGLPPMAGFLAIAVLWWSLAVVAGSTFGRLPGLLVPLACAVVASSKLVPWHANIVFHPDLGAARLMAAGIGLMVALLCYGLLGSGQSRARLRG